MEEARAVARSYFNALGVIHQQVQTYFILYP